MIKTNRVAVYKSGDSGVVRVKHVHEAEESTEQVLEEFRLAIDDVFCDDPAGGDAEAADELLGEATFRRTERAKAAGYTSASPSGP